MLDEELLRRLSASPEVKEVGRSEVVRRALDAYLRAQRREEISRQYREAYAKTDRLNGELDGWAAEGSWPGE